MRKIVNVIWLEDKQTEPTYQQNMEIVKKLIEAKGYVAKIHPFSTFEEARKCIQDNSVRVDFFISDFNLTESAGSEQLTGLNFLDEVRTKGKYKEFFILYSKLSEEKIQTKVFDKMKQKGIEILSNFTFISLTDYSGKENMTRMFEKAIGICLSRWDELNALRGMYMYENAEIEHMLRAHFGVKYSEDTSYKTLVYGYKNERVKRSGRDASFYDEWFKLIKERNALAHTEEHVDGRGYYISGNYPNGLEFNIYEDELDEKRKELLDMSEKIKKYIDKR